MVMTMSSVMIACADERLDDGDDQAAEAELRASGCKALAGRWKSSTSQYLSSITLRADGTFLGGVNIERLDAPCSNTASPDCTNITAGDFNVARGKVSFDVPKIVEVTEHAKTLAFTYKLTANPRQLVLDGDQGVQIFDYYAGCEGVTCSRGEECREGPRWGAAVCGPPQSPVIAHDEVVLRPVGHASPCPPCAVGYRCNESRRVCEPR